MRQRGAVWGERENTHTLYTMLPSQECEGVSHTGAGNSKYRRLLWLDMNRKTTGRRKAKIKLLVMSPKSYICSELSSIQNIKKKGCGASKEMLPKGGRWSRLHSCYLHGYPESGVASSISICEWRGIKQVAKQRCEPRPT